MKKSYIIIFSILISSMAIGQSHSNFFTHFSKKEVYNNNKVQKIIRHQENKTKTVKFSVKQKLDSITLQSYYGGVWFDAFKQTFNYDANGNNISSIEYETNGVTLDPSIKEEYVYNNQNQLTQYSDYSWNLTNNNWDNSRRTDITYSPNAYVSIIKTWNMATNSWNNINKYEYIKDSNNQDSLEIEYKWSNATNSWENESIIFYNYVNGLLVSQMYLNWVVNGYVPANKSDYTYNANNKLVEDLGYNWNGNLWEMNEKQQRKYDANNMAISVVNFDYLTFSNTWNYYDSISYVNQAMNIDYFERLKWINNQWEKREKEDFTHDNTYDISSLILPNDYTADDEILQYFTHMLTNLDLYDGDSANWVQSAKVQFHYSSININSIRNIETQDISISPNPATNYFYINTASKITNIEIYDISGKKVKSLTLNESNKIDISELKNGLYFVRITDNKNVSFTKKIIKHSEN